MCSILVNVCVSVFENCMRVHRKGCLCVFCAGTDSVNDFNKKNDLTDAKLMIYVPDNYLVEELTSALIK